MRTPIFCLILTFLIFSCSSSDGPSEKSYLSDKKQTILLEGQPYQVSSGDFNEDGRVDIAVAVKYKGVYLFYNNGVDFSTYSLLYTAPHPLSLKATDLDSDSHLDLVVLSEGYTEIYKGDGRGNFLLASSFPMQLGRFVNTGDLNKDGLPDIIAVNTLNPDIYIYINKGNLIFEPLVITIPIDDMQFYFSTEFVTSSDLDDDGFHDILVTDYINGALWVLWNSNGSQFSPQILYYHGKPISCSGVINLPEGRYVLLTVEDPLDSSLILLRHMGGREYIKSEVIPTTPLPSHILVTDIEGNGQEDVILTHIPWYDYEKGSVSIYLNSLSGAPIIISSEGRSINSEACDFNGDGIKDIFTANILSETITYIPSKTFYYATSIAHK